MVSVMFRRYTHVTQKHFLCNAAVLAGNRPTHHSQFAKTWGTLTCDIDKCITYTLEDVCEYESRCIYHSYKCINKMNKLTLYKTRSSLIHFACIELLL